MLESTEHSDVAALKIPISSLPNRCEGDAMASRTLRFSLILATIGRENEVKRYLQLLDQQTYRNFEVIIVDQNPDPILEPLVREFQERLAILHVRSEVGLSRGRNIGLQYYSGNVIAFPDDDCWYSPDTLERVASELNTNSHYDGLTGRGVDPDRPGDYMFFSRKRGWVDKTTVWRRCTSFSIFLRENVVRAVGLFDESLGVGSGTGKNSAEEVDYLIRAIEYGFRIYYRIDLCIFHRYPTCNYNRDFIRKGYGYAVGLGSVLKKHDYSLAFVCWRFLRPLGGAVISLMTLNISKAKYHLAVLRGRVLGWLG